MKEYACDFETTVYEGQTNTEVWAAGIVGVENPLPATIFHSIDEFMEHVINLAKMNNDNTVLYFHNLKFDGSFILNWLLRNKHFKEGFVDGENPHMKDIRELGNNEYVYLISDMGQWYNIRIKLTGRVSLVIRDSLKLLPFSLKVLGDSFKTEHRKLSMVYTGYRYAGCEITPEEEEYLKNDLYVLKEALEIAKAEGACKNTIGGCAVHEFKQTFRSGIQTESGVFDINDWKTLFPNLSTPLSPELQASCGSASWDEYCRKAYLGGYVYVNPKYQGKIVRNGTTADVNSLYPSVMHSDGGNYYPVGMPHYVKGCLPDFSNVPENEHRYYFVRFKCYFNLKDGYLPFVSVKHNPLYPSNRVLTTSFPMIKGKLYTGEIDGSPSGYLEMTMTCTEYERFLEHYEVYGLDILDSVWFYAEKGLFDKFIDHWKHIKETSTGGRRTYAKLNLNNLYGKFATSDNSSFKRAILHEGRLIFQTYEEHAMETFYIPIGAAVTGFARDFTIRAAQKYYNTFCYSDTDSIHVCMPPELITELPVDDNKFNHWKLESCWDMGLFVRPKTYAEHITHENLVPLPPEKVGWKLTCAGMPSKCKNMFLCRVEGKPMLNEDKQPIPPTELPDNIRYYIYDDNLDFKPLNITDFKAGLTVPCKLRPKQIPGGVLLEECNFTMRG